ncbi:MAG: cytoplasmic protein [Chloroflexi bacterium]|jgi:hypothetical protein|nr:cytoplasmic protein [Chloroflexota bacterium]MDP7088315.1 crosslink repair DNA glycosylase YcaQ family protein [Dehalococcoidia bacterium]|tara:strand:+ start:79 stop:1308 length:1230 start_codon:yes stop_codon:yes gene_type:complete
MVLSLSKQDVKRIAIRAQGLDHNRVATSKANDACKCPKIVTTGDLRRSILAMGLLQIDAVNVCVRSHYMPLFSRLGIYQRELLDELAYKDKEIFETWAHAACFVPVEHHLLFRQRMAQQKPRPLVEKLKKERPGYLEDVLSQVASRGQLSASELEGSGKRSGSWWGYQDGKIAAEWHFSLGNFSIGERHNFTRYYDLTERVIPSEHLYSVTPSVRDSNREMMRLAIKAHGVGSTRDFGNYYHLKDDSALTAINELLEEGSIQRVRIEGWPNGIDTFAAKENISSQPTDARALLTPFDPLVWNRSRIERIFDFLYRIEIYVPEQKRQYGYYVYPFLLGEDLIARVDLKAERNKSVLVVKGAFVEDGYDHDQIAAPLADELLMMAQWLGLERVGTGAKGNLMQSLRAALII